MSRSGEGCSPPGLLGPRSGHHLLQRVPAGVRPASLHPPLSRLWPGRVWRLLSGAAPGALPRLGPPGEGLQRLQSETRGALAGRGGQESGGGKTVKDCHLYKYWNWCFDWKASGPCCLFLVAFFWSPPDCLWQVGLSLFVFSTLSPRHFSPMTLFHFNMPIFYTVNTGQRETWISTYSREERWDNLTTFLSKWVLCKLANDWVQVNYDVPFFFFLLL